MFNILEKAKFENIIVFYLTKLGWFLFSLENRSRDVTVSPRGSPTIITGKPLIRTIQFTVLLSLCLYPLWLYSWVLMGQVEVFRRDHLIRLAKSIKTKQSIVTFLKNDRYLLLLCLYPIEFTVSKLFILTDIDKRQHMLS